MVMIEHIGLWAHDIESLKNFYCLYFDAQENELYQNPKKGFASYFLTFRDGARLEIMSRTDIQKGQPNTFGFAHLAFSLGTKEAVNQLTQTLSEAGYEHIDGPRTTGDGYYEAVIKDPEGNLIELTV